MSSPSFFFKVCGISLNIQSAFEPPFSLYFKLPLREYRHFPPQFIEIGRFRKIENVKRSLPLPVTVDFEEEPGSVTVRVDIIFK